MEAKPSVQRYTVKRWSCLGSNARKYPSINFNQMIGLTNYRSGQSANSAECVPKFFIYGTSKWMSLSCWGRGRGWGVSNSSYWHIWQSMHRGVVENPFPQETKTSPVHIINIIAANDLVPPRAIASMVSTQLCQWWLTTISDHSISACNKKCKFHLPTTQNRLYTIC